MSSAKTKTADAPEKPAAAAPAAPPAAATGTEVAKVTRGAVGRPVSTAIGFEGVDNSALKTPFIKLLQNGSPELETVPGAKAGYFYNSQNNDVAGTIDFVPAAYERSIIEYVPKKQGGGFVAKHKDSDKIWLDAVARNPDGEFGKPTTSDGNELVDTRSFFGMVRFNNDDGNVTPGILSFTSTGINYSKAWIGLALMQQIKGVILPLPKHVYTIAPLRKENNDGVWWVPVAGFGDKTGLERRLGDDDPLYLDALDIHSKHVKGKIEVDYDQSGAKDNKGDGGKVPF